MSRYLLWAYLIFCAGPLGLAISIAIRRQRVRQESTMLARAASHTP